jgi:hypothetical protein
MLRTGEETMNAYIEILAEFRISRHELGKAELCFIGEFTRENIESWLKRGNYLEVGIYGYKDFHAVCGDIDIPWATEEARLCWTTKLPFEN